VLITDAENMVGEWENKLMYTSITSKYLIVLSFISVVSDMQYGDPIVPADLEEFPVMSK